MPVVGIVFPIHSMTHLLIDALTGPCLLVVSPCRAWHRTFANAVPERPDVSKPALGILWVSALSDFVRCCVFDGSWMLSMLIRTMLRSRPDAILCQKMLRSRSHAMHPLIQSQLPTVATFTIHDSLDHARIAPQLVSPFAMLFDADRVGVTATSVLNSQTVSQYAVPSFHDSLDHARFVAQFAMRPNGVLPAPFGVAA